MNAQSGNEAQWSLMNNITLLDTLRGEEFERTQRFVARTDELKTTFKGKQNLT